jgi:hypothetical protein
MEGKSIEIGGEIFDLTDPAQKKAAIRAWLKAKAGEKKAESSPVCDEAHPDILAAAPRACGADKYPEA